ncbi:hypothetical protein [Streptomyces sudanensis]|uniref:hypothetical protein n=1 Tax=Streptomyces sudanensis TaxID=436397 RepID=UPI003FD8E5FE
MPPREAVPPAPDPEETEAPAPSPAGTDPEGIGGTDPEAVAGADPEAVAVLAALRRVDPRLVLSAREAAHLAPAVARWLTAGVGPREITELLTLRLPDRFRARPAHILAFRLRETPLPAPPPTGRPVVPPLQTCDGCERAFRAAGPGRCRDCRHPGHPLPAAA